MYQNQDSDMVPSVLQIASVSHAYGAKKALDDVSFSIPAGRFTVLLGLNGAGKTTLFSLISRLYDTQSGSIRIFGEDIRRAPCAALRRLGIVFQARTLDLDLSVAQNLAYHAALHGIGRRAAMARINVLLADVDLADRLHDKAKNLSGGQMRRVEIVRALLHRPSLLLLDEATVGLDIRARADILATIRALVRDTGIAVLWATHLIDEVAADDDVVILDHGRVRATGAVHDVVATAGTEDIAGAFVGLVRETPVRPGPALVAAAIPEIGEGACVQPIASLKAGPPHMYLARRGLPPSHSGGSPIAGRGLRPDPSFLAPHDLDPGADGGSK